MMKSWYVAALIASASLTGGVHAADNSVVVAGQRNASEWFRVESQHFIVYSDTSNEDVVLLLNQLEKLDYMLRIYVQPFLKTTGAEPKLTFYYHDRETDLNALAVSQPANAIGLYSSCAAGVQGFGVQLTKLERLDNAQLAKAPPDESLAYLFEAYTRHFLYRYTDIRAPISFIDGMAQYFASMRFSDTRMLVGKTPLNIGRYFAFLDKGRRYSLDYKDVLEQNDSRGVSYAATAGIKLEFAARAWILTHYMLSSEDNRKRMAAYLSSVYRDVPITQAFEQAYGIKVGDLGTALWRYRLQAVKVMQVDVPELPAASMDFKALPQSSGEFVLAEAALKSCPGRKTGVALLGQIAGAAARYPSNAYAQRTLARAQIDWGDPQDALPYLATATRQPDAEAFYLLGLANLRLSRLDAARAALKRSLALQPASAEASHALYLAGLQAAAPDDATLQAAVTAWDNGHEVSTLARAAGLAYAYVGDTAHARNAFRLMAHNIRDPELQAWGKTWLDKLQAGVSPAEVLAEMRMPAADHTFREWTIANASVMQDVEYNAGLQDARAYLDQQSVNPAHPEQVLQTMPMSR